MKLQNYWGKKMPKENICILAYCSKPITGIRGVRGYETCSAPCAYIHNLNMMTIHRSTKKNIETAPCSTPGCSRIFAKCAENITKCPKCLGNRSGRPPGRKNERGTGSGPGRAWNDHRSSVCNRPAGLCGNYSRCLDLVAFSDGKLKCQTNGGIDCWESPQSRPINFFRCALGAAI